MTYTNHHHLRCVTCTSWTNKFVSEYDILQYREQLTFLNIQKQAFLCSSEYVFRQKNFPYNFRYCWCSCCFRFVGIVENSCIVCMVHGTTTHSDTVRMVCTTMLFPYSGTKLISISKYLPGLNSNNFTRTTTTTTATKNKPLLIYVTSYMLTNTVRGLSTSVSSSLFPYSRSFHLYIVDRFRCCVVCVYIYIS